MVFFGLKYELFVLETESNEYSPVIEIRNARGPSDQDLKTVQRSFQYHSVVYCNLVLLSDDLCGLKIAAATILV